LRGRTVLVLLILVVGLVAFIELFEHELPSSEERAALEKLVLVTEVSEITAVELTWGEKHVRLEREPTDEDEEAEEEDLSTFAWRLVEPIAARADPDLVASLIESLTTLEKRRTLAGSTPDEVGLSRPRLTATLIAGDRQIGLLVGSDVPAGDSMIVSSASGGEIFVVDKSIWPELIREPGDWRSRQVLDVGQESVKRVVLEQADERLVLARQGADFWLEDPVVDRADAGRVGNLLTALTSMQVASFLDELPESVSNLGLDPPVGAVEVTAGNAAEALRLVWGNAVPETGSRHYAGAEGQVFATEMDLQQYFETPVAEWRSLELTSMETFQIDAVEVIQQGQDTMSLGRDGADWKRDEDKISFTSVSDLLYAITGARAAALLADSKEELPQLDSSRPALEMVLQGGDREQTVSFLSLSEKGVPAVVSDREIVLLVGQDEFTEILAKVAQVRAAKSVKAEADEELLSGSPELSSDQQK